jgi:hypothetical protein
MKTLKVHFLRHIKCGVGLVRWFESTGRFRALVTCIVETKGKRYHNLRVFVRDDPTQQLWKLLGWANEEIDHRQVQ